MYLNYPLPSNTPYMYMYRVPKLATRAETVFRNGIIKSRKKIAMPIVSKVPNDHSKETYRYEKGI